MSRSLISIFLALAVLGCPALCSAAAVSACCPCETSAPDDHQKDDCDERPCFCSSPSPDLAQTRDTLSHLAVSAVSVTHVADSPAALSLAGLCSLNSGWPPTGTNAGLLSLPLLI
ncbi:MAG: hypothetical protein IT419_00555 [Planctomycetes bacterium]|nr:hypothetical protein [Planctomycetota bacterium]